MKPHLHQTELVLEAAALTLPASSAVSATGDNSSSNLLWPRLHAAFILFLSRKAS